MTSISGQVIDVWWISEDSSNQVISLSHDGWGKHIQYSKPDYENIYTKATKRTINAINRLFSVGGIPCLILAFALTSLQRMMHPFSILDKFDLSSVVDGLRECGSCNRLILVRALHSRLATISHAFWMHIPGQQPFSCSIICYNTRILSSTCY